MDTNVWILAVGICVIAWVLNFLSKNVEFKKPKWLSAQTWLVSSTKKIKVEEITYIDPKTRLALIDYNSEKFFILLGSNNDLLLKIVKNQPEGNNTIRPDHPLPVEDLLRAMR